MAQLTPGLVLVIVLLFAPQLVAAQLALLFRGPFVKGLLKGFDLGVNLFGGSPPKPPVVGGNSNGDTNCSTPAVGFQAPVRWTDDMAGYVVELGISGTASSYNFLVATANNFVWTDQCRSFPASAVVPQPCNSKECGLLPTSSPCVGNSECQYASQQMNGYLADSIFTLTNSKPFNLSFGCNEMATNYGAVYKRVVGMGRGPLSLTSQLQVSKFSYCFTNYGDTSISGQMLFGSYASFDEGTSVAKTPYQLTANCYSIKLTGISIGQTSVAPFSATQVIIDSSTPLTYLDISAFTSFWNALGGFILLAPRGTYPPYDICFSLQYSQPIMSNITFDFDGAKMNFPIRNYLFFYPGSNGQVLCFAIMLYQNPNPMYAGYSILGNFQQQNIQFVYDLQNGTLSFGSVDCSGLRPRKDDTIVPCERSSSPATSNGAGVELGGRVAALIPCLFFFYFLFVPFLVI